MNKIQDISILANKEQKQLLNIWKSKMRQTLVDQKVSTNRNDECPFQPDISTPSFFSSSDYSSAKLSESQNCKTCQPIVRQLCATIEKLLAAKNYSSSLLAKKEEQLSTAFKLLEESQKREVHLINCLEERNKQYEILNDKFREASNQNDESEIAQVMSRKYMRVIKYLKAREYQLLTKVKELELQLISTESVLQSERLRHDLQPQETFDTHNNYQNESIYSMKKRPYKTQIKNSDNDFQIKQKGIVNKNKNESLNLDAMETQAEIYMKDEINPQIPILLKEMQENMSILMEQQKILIQRNHYLEKRKVNE